MTCVENFSPPESVVGAGRGSLILAMAGAGWLGWGLGAAEAFNAIVGAIFGAVSILLWFCSIYVIRTGLALRRRNPPFAGSVSRFPTRPFVLIVLVEFAAIGLVLIAAVRLHRADAAALGCTLVVGLHYLPLAKIFRAPILMFLGVLISLWCVLSWALFRSNALIVAVSTGTGILLWAASIAILLRARRLTGLSRSQMLQGNPRGPAAQGR